MNTFGDELKKIREKRKLTQGEFAEKLSVSLQSYGNIERDMMQGITKNMRMIAESDFLTSAEKQPLRKVVEEDSRDESSELGDTFGDELRRIRLGKGLSIAKFSEYLGMNKNTYTGLESNRLTPGAGSAVTLSKNEKLTAEQRERLQEYVPEKKLNPEKFKKKKVKKPAETKQPLITDAQRLEYRRRKNAAYFKEKAVSDDSSNQSFKRAISRSAKQRIFY